MMCSWPLNTLRVPSMCTRHVFVAASADVISPLHQPIPRDVHHINDTNQIYSTPSSRSRLSMIGERDPLRWETSAGSAAGSATAITSPGHFHSGSPSSFTGFPVGGGIIAPSGVPPICQWDQCGMQLQDTSPAGVKHHLRTRHGITRAACERGDRGQCQWHADGRPCGAPLDFSSFPKHVSTVHLKATARKCGDCGRRIGRADSLTRHQRDHCPVRRRVDWPESWSGAA